MKKRVISLTLVLVIAMSTISAQALTVHELLDATILNMAAAQSYEMQFKMNLDAESVEDKTSMSAKADLKYIKEPLLMSMAVSLKMDDEGFNTKIYAQAVEDEIILYITTEGDTVKLTVPLNDELFVQMKNIQPQNDASKSFKDWDFVGSKKIRGRINYIISLKLNFDELEKQFKDQLAKQNNILEEFTSGYTQQDNLEEIERFFDDLSEKTSVLMYIDAREQTLTRMEMDFSKLFESLLAQSSAEYPIDFKATFTITIDYKNINNVKPFKIPSSVKDSAQEIGA